MRRKALSADVYPILFMTSLSRKKTTNRNRMMMMEVPFEAGFSLAEKTLSLGLRLDAHEATWLIQCIMRCGKQGQVAGRASGG